ncbi:transposase [Devosia albogilva]|uniref:Transposase n=1 Tax=Devosia albogilva TaxID=429726 RepID=A0ABW5QQY3_9HYPH
MIAAFTVLFGMDRAAADPTLAGLHEHLVFIDQLVQDIARLKTRLEHLHDTRLASLVAADIAALKARLRDERRRLERAVRADKALGRRLDLLLSVPGIGIPTALALLIAMPELGSISREQAAALIGLAPFDHDSGKHHGRRHIAGGRARPRRPSTPRPCLPPIDGTANSWRSMPALLPLANPTSSPLSPALENSSSLPTPFCNEANPGPHS